MNAIFANFVPGPGMMIVLLVVGILLFGRRLPEIGRSLGKTITEFKKGVKGLEDEVEPTNMTAARTVDPEPLRPPQRLTAAAPKFDDAPAPVAAPKVEEKAPTPPQHV
ncbi:twin-arginine translocase TatA/TatE family subunit [Telmatocola sphagniphila]|uniref:Twin-arginine translocase TatA/TatE family subunit n=1 Tax=Telmatocola sphagniphila TaxID=1123043 RepID=A0A8E6EX30_9BACT|nr:twin-arginine translocase TatA/TatE family subunit [Telmatocola sphagniphila]QVL34645.1 twin-arginine translocase TatA/TatE family subunit [Telmatocola sphagniphila]